MKIGIIGPLDSSQKIENYLYELDNKLKINLYVREKSEDAIDVIDICENECDCIIFTGCGVYESVKAKHNIKLPHVFVSRGGTSIMKALLKAFQANVCLERFSIDVVENNILEDILNEIDIKSSNVFSLPFSNKLSEMDYAKWHLSLYEKGEVDVMFTGFAGVYNYLKSMNYPIFRLEAARPLIRVSYEELMSKYELNKAKDSQIGVEILHLVENKDDKENYYSTMIKKSDLDKLIIEYTRSIHGSIFNFGRDEYIIFAHKGAIECDDNYTNLLSLKKDVSSLGFNLGVGIGIGNTSYQAESNAYKALKRTLNTDDLSIFLINENDFLKGPLGSTNELNYSLVTYNDSLLYISKKTGLSCESISKIISTSETRNSNIYDTKELANYLNISDRSARRILNKILVAGFGKVCAKETSGASGRPRNLIEILF